MMFVKILEEVSNQVGYETERIYDRPSSDIPFENKLDYAIKIWCIKFDITGDISNYILQAYKLYEVKELIKYIWQEGITEKKNWKIPTIFGEAPTWITTENQFYKYINPLFKLMNTRSDSMKFIVLIAFGITAVGYWLYKLNQQGQQHQTRREEPKQYTPSPPPSPSPKIINQFLVLVISASQADFLKSIQAKTQINLSDGERLYEVTKYLWLVSETEFSQKTANIINKYSVSKGEESEYDIYLVYIKLKKSNNGFKANVGQLDRYDAFRELGNLAENFEISPRLQIEAYGNIEVYSR
jgi:hypothetical protein